MTISAEARKLLELMATRSGTTHSAMVELAIRERARRENVGASETKSITPAADALDSDAPAGRLRQIVEQARAGDQAAAEAMRRVIERLQSSTIIPETEITLSPDELLARRERYLSLAEAIREGVPEEWTPEEVEQRVADVIAEVREERRASRR